MPLRPQTDFSFCWRRIGVFTVFNQAGISSPLVGSSSQSDGTQTLVLDHVEPCWACSFCRKKGILFCHMFGFVAAALYGSCKVAGSFEMLILARLIVGFGCGAFAFCSLGLFSICKLNSFVLRLRIRTETTRLASGDYHRVTEAIFSWCVDVPNAGQQADALVVVVKVPRTTLPGFI